MKNIGGAGGVHMREEASKEEDVLSVLSFLLHL